MQIPRWQQQGPVLHTTVTFVFLWPFL